MTVTDARVFTEETPIEELVTSERAAKHLRAAGFGTLAEVKREGVASAAAVRYVGDATVRELDAALRSIEPQGGDPASTQPEDPLEFVEECARPLGLYCAQSPATGRPIGLHLPMLKAFRRVHGDGSSSVEEPIWIEFDDGRASITREMWFMRKFRRDHNQVHAAVEQNVPWRRECAAWVMSHFRAYGRDFWIESD